MTTYQTKALENDKAKTIKYRELMEEVASIQHNNTITHIRMVSDAL